LTKLVETLDLGRVVCQCPIQPVYRLGQRRVKFAKLGLDCAVSGIRPGGRVEDGWWNWAQPIKEIANMKTNLTTALTRKEALAGLRGALQKLKLARQQAQAADKSARQAKKEAKRLKKAAKEAKRDAKRARKALAEAQSSYNQALLLAGPFLRKRRRTTARKPSAAAAKKAGTQAQPAKPKPAAQKPQAVAPARKAARAAKKAPEKQSAPAETAEKEIVVPRDWERPDQPSTNAPGQSSLPSETPPPAA